MQYLRCERTKYSVSIFLDLEYISGGSIRGCSRKRGTIKESLRSSLTSSDLVSPSMAINAPAPKRLKLSNPQQLAFDPTLFTSVEEVSRTADEMHQSRLAKQAHCASTGKDGGGEHGDLKERTCNNVFDSGTRAGKVAAGGGEETRQPERGKEKIAKHTATKTLCPAIPVPKRLPPHKRGNVSKNASSASGTSSVSSFPGRDTPRGDSLKDGNENQNTVLELSESRLHKQGRSGPFHSKELDADIETRGKPTVIAVQSSKSFLGGENDGLLDTKENSSSDSSSPGDTDDEADEQALWKVISDRYASIRRLGPAKPINEYQAVTIRGYEDNDQDLPADPSWVCVCTVPISNAELRSRTEFPPPNCLFYQPSSSSSCTMASNDDSRAICICTQSLKDHPEHPWIFTQSGCALAKSWRQKLKDRPNASSQSSCDQSDYLISILKVATVATKGFGDEMRRRPRRPLVIWAHVEAMALFLHENISCRQRLSSERDGMIGVTNMFGEAFVETLRFLSKKWPLNPFASPTQPNQNLVLLLLSTLMRRLENDDSRRPVFYRGAEAIRNLTKNHGLYIDGVKSINSNARASHGTFIDELNRPACKSLARDSHHQDKRGPEDTSQKKSVEDKKTSEQPRPDFFSPKPPEWLSLGQKAEWSDRATRKSLIPVSLRLYFLAPEDALMYAER